MTAEECHRRAQACSDNAAAASEPELASEFLRLAAVWRAMAIREVFLGHVDNRVQTVSPPRSSPVSKPSVKRL